MIVIEKIMAYTYKTQLINTYTEDILLMKDEAMNLKYYFSECPWKPLLLCRLTFQF